MGWGGGGAGAWREGHQWNFGVMAEGQGFEIFESQGRVMILDTGNISFAKFLMHFQPFEPFVNNRSQVTSRSEIQFDGLTELNTADSVGSICGLVKDKRGRAYRLPAKIIRNVVHEVKQNKENQESAVFLNSRPLRLPFDSDVRHDWEDSSMDSGTDPFAKCQLLLEIRFWWMRMQNSQTEPGVAARLEVNPSKAPMFCLIVAAWNRVCVSRTKAAVHRRLTMAVARILCAGGQARGAPVTPVSRGLGACSPRKFWNLEALKCHFRKPFQVLTSGNDFLTEIVQLHT